VYDRIPRGRRSTGRATRTLGEVLLISGRAGVGQTTLVRWFAEAFPGRLGGFRPGVLVATIFAAPHPWADGFRVRGAVNLALA